MKICIVGLGYVGLPLFLNLSKKFEVYGFDNSKKRVTNLKEGIDIYGESNRKEILPLIDSIKHSEQILENMDIYILTVPTPIDSQRKPDLKYLENATKLVSKYLKKGGTIIYESTVFPGCTREICIPIIEEVSKLKLNQDFYIGYSPERLSPGKDGKKITDIVKVISGSNTKAMEILRKVYSTIIRAGLFEAPSIEAAEAAKIIENTQRDVNIALMNEFALVLDKLGLHWSEVLPAAYTKWNFNKYYPGLVGGHCIGVDPYYLSFKAEQLGIETKMVLAGREVNENFAKETFNRYLNKRNNKNPNKILLAGATFKEDCDDLRNSKVEEFCKFLDNEGIEFTLFDPSCSSDKTEKYFYKIEKKIKLKKYDQLILLVPHQEFKDELSKNNHYFFGAKIEEFFSLRPLENFDKFTLI